MSATPTSGRGITSELHCYAVWSAAVAFLALCAGCGIDLEFEYLEDERPTHAFVDVEGIEIAIGTAVGVRVTDGGSHFDEDVAITMESEDPEVLSVGASTAHDEFVLWAVAAGSTFVSVDIDGSAIEKIDAQVVTP